MCSLSDVIKKILKSKNITIEGLSKRISISQTALHGNFKRNDFKYKILLEIAKALDVSLSYIILESEKENIYEIDDGKNKVSDDGAKYLTSAGRELLEKYKECKKEKENLQLLVNMFKTKDNDNS